MYYAVGVYLGLCYIKYDGVCARRTDPLPQIFLEVKNNWAKGHFYTLPAALSLSLWMMTKLEPAASVCHHLPTSNHDREKKKPEATNHQIYSCIFSHPCEQEQAPFSIIKKFLGQMLIS